MKYLLGILIILLTCFRSFGQGKEELTLKEAIKIGLDNNIRLKQERNNLTSFKASQTASYASLGPNINARADAYRIDGNYFNEQTGDVLNQTLNRLEPAVSANITIFNGLSQLNSVKRDNHRLFAQSSLIERTEQDIIGEVSRQYLQILQDQEQVIIAKQNLENQQLLYDQISAMFDLGSRAITDKYDQYYQVKNAELRKIRAENTLINDKAILAQTIMVDPSLSFVLVEPSWDVDDIRFEDYDYDEIINTALIQRSDLASVKENEQAAMRNISVQKGNYIPTLAGFFSLSSAYSDILVTRDIQEQLLIDNKRQVYGLQLQIPIFAGYRSRANVIGAQINHENAQLEIENQEMLVKTDVLRAYQNFRDVALTYQTSLVQFQAAEKSLETQRESYQLGLSNLIEVSTANNIFVDAQTSLSRAKYALLFQKILIDYASGTLQVDQIPD